MTIVQLEYLVAVADHGSFSLASIHCCVTQPSLSTQIKNLEEELGVVLIDRKDKPLKLTVIGKVVVEMARDAISKFYSLPNRVKEEQNEVAGELCLAVIPTIAPYMLHLFIPKFMKKYPKVKLTIRELFTRDIASSLKRGVVDIGLLAGGFVNTKDIDEETLYKDKFYLYVSDNSPLRGKKEVTVNDIEIENLLLLADGHCLRSQVLDLCSNANSSAKSMNFESGSIETIVRMVGTSGGMTILPEMATPFIREDRKNCILPFTKEVGANRDITLAVAKNFYKKAIYKALKEEIIEMRKQQYFLI